MSLQNTKNIIVVSPIDFGYNHETSSTNSFQKDFKINDLKVKVLEEFEGLISKLFDEGIEITLLPSPGENCPDGLYINNWLVTSKDCLDMMAMLAPNRRLERQLEMLLDQLELVENTPNIHNYATYESDNKFLEGTGAMVLDRINTILYMGKSERANTEIAQIWASQMVLRWNSFFENLVQTYQKLNELGLVYYNGNVTVINRKEEGL